LIWTLSVFAALAWVFGLLAGPGIKIAQGIGDVTYISIPCDLQVRNKHQKHQPFQNPARFKKE
jgi:hypothetical protein